MTEEDGKIDLITVKMMVVVDMGLLRIEEPVVGVGVVSAIVVEKGNAEMLTLEIIVTIDGGVGTGISSMMATEDMVGAYHGDEGACRICFEPILKTRFSTGGGDFDSRSGSLSEQRVPGTTVMIKGLPAHTTEPAVSFLFSAMNLV